jgi:DNA replication and repair protein RecF
MRNFRNHAETSIEFGDGMNALWGGNGQGKTNVLEAISYLSLTKSFYAANDATVLYIGKEMFEVEGRIISDADIEHTVRAAYTRTGDKLFTVNGVRPETLSSVIGRFPLVVLSPENNAITFGAPNERRKFLDLLLSQISRSYLDDVIEYRRVLRQRNKLLLEAKLEHVYTEELIEPWTQSLIQLGSRIIAHRNAFVSEFHEYVMRSYQQLVRSDETPSIEYRTVEGVRGTCTVQDIATSMRDELGAKMYEERRRGSTLVGPHRDDLLFRINGISVQHYASQGQHKTMLVALKLAEFFYLRERRHEVPIFLLDDMFSELDERRSRLLLETVSSLGPQTFITTTDEAVFHTAVEWNSVNRKFYVEQGAVKPN